MDRVVSGACFLAGGMLNCDLSHRRSVAALCMLYKIWCNPKHPLCGTLPVPYVPVRVTRGALIAHQYTFAPPRCRTSQYHRTFILLSVSLWNDLVDPVFEGVGLAGFKSRSNSFLLAQLLSPFCLKLFSLSLIFFYRLVVWGWGLRTDRMSTPLSRPCITQSFLIIIIKRQASRYWHLHLFSYTL